MTIADDSTWTHRAPNGVPRRFDVRDVASGGTHTLVLAGELDVAAGFELEEAIMSCADASGLTLDLSRLTFMGSTGLRMVLLARDLCALRGMAFALIPGPSQVQRVFEVSALVNRLPFRPEPTN
jgi:anti-sigma B factor antagonist